MREEKTKKKTKKRDILYEIISYVLFFILIFITLYLIDHFLNKNFSLIKEITTELSQCFKLTPSEQLHAKMIYLGFLIFLSILSFILIISKAYIHILRFLHRFSKRFHILIVIISVIIVIFLLVSYSSTKKELLKLDKSTTVTIEERILIIEIDDYWNLAQDGAGPYHGPYGYTMERFRDVSDTINKYGFKASLGVTPYIFVEELRENFDLRDDPEMVEYLRELENQGYELAMHGYNHCRNEYYCPKYEEVWYNVLNGKIALEQIFGKRLTTYFPPGNQWTTEQYENVKEAGFLVIGNTHVPKAYFDEEVIITPKGYDPIYHYGWYQKDFRHTNVDEWIEEYNKKNLFILQLHCNTFDSQEKLNDLDSFLKYVKEDGAKVMTYKEFYYYIQNKIKSEEKTISGKVIIEV